MDFIKSDRRRDDFARACPEMVIVDEAHTCAFGYDSRGGRHQRHQLLRRLSENPDRHLILVTATPHSGKEEAFRSLLALLKPDFSGLPEDLTGPENEQHRRHLAAHFVQRRRGDIRHFMKTETPFPRREDGEETYKLTPEYRDFFDRILRYTQEIVAETEGGRHRQRVRWWSALALLRSIGSSPAAAAATLRNRAPAAETASPEEADEIGRRTVLDLETEDQTEGVDVPPGCDTGEEPEETSKTRRRLLEMAREAEKLKGDSDAKLLGAVPRIEGFLLNGFRPILFCRFIPTAEYVAEELRKRLPTDVQVAAVTGLLPPSDREARVLELAKSPNRVLVCTECLSEGINLQEHFDAVMHYDLSWNPTRHEQREGRVDRFGQPRETVRVLTYYGVDNPIDGIVLDVLLRKHTKIKNSLGISVPVPANTDAVIEAVAEGLLLRGKGHGTQTLLPFVENYMQERTSELHGQWDDAAAKEKRSRTMFAQETIKADEVSLELDAARKVSGSSADVASFTLDALRARKAVISEVKDHYRFDLREVPKPLLDAFGDDIPSIIKVRFEPPAGDDILYLQRTHPFVEALASHVLETALDPKIDSVAHRAGAIRTSAVSKRTTLLLLRFRFDIVTVRAGTEQSQLAEECRMIGFAGAPENPEWLKEEETDALFRAEPSANILPEQATHFVQNVIAGYDLLSPRIEEEARERAGYLLDAHRRVRAAAGIRGVTYRVEPKLPADVLGIYVYLPAASGG
jgi:hypothetical protein